MTKRNKNFSKWLYPVIIILLILFFFFIIWLLISKGIITLPGQQTFIDATRDEEPGVVIPDIISNCLELCREENYDTGYSSDSCELGEVYIEYGYPGEVPLLTCCCFDIPEEEPEDAGYEVGDIVGGIDTSGSLAGGDEYVTLEIDLSNVETGGPCHLGARIWTSWNWADSVIECTGIQGTEMIDWVFYDSTGLVWVESDLYPQSNYVDLCPLVYIDGVNWELKMFKILNLPDCAIDYTTKVEVYVCECD